ncbi:unnamed protein product [Heligmosomoides polygyrus]|uniref:SSD domain-containing protein n=1 Tax=Heligmosomoides polygyrus TaxID=6339 RepID=A0A183G9C0_HELPZ|nr:unnamed protein product [Heligmosomoides polygyrus]
MVKFVSQKTEVFCSVSTAFAALASANTIYMLAGFGSETSVTMKVLSFLWMNCTMAVILITHRQPAQTQAEVNNTAQLLLADDIAQHSQDEQIWRTFRSMVDRAHHSSTKMYLLQAFAVDEHLAHKILLIVPNIGTLMVLIKKMGLV